jgi:hypothetical protein
MTSELTSLYRVTNSSCLFYCVPLISNWLAYLFDCIEISLTHSLTMICSSQQYCISQFFHFVSQSLIISIELQLGIIHLDSQMPKAAVCLSTMYRGECNMKTFIL